MEKGNEGGTALAAKTRGEEEEEEEAGRRGGQRVGEERHTRKRHTRKRHTRMGAGAVSASAAKIEMAARGVVGVLMDRFHLILSIMILRTRARMEDKKVAEQKEGGGDGGGGMGDAGGSKPRLTRGVLGGNGMLKGGK